MNTVVHAVPGMGSGDSSQGRVSSGELDTTHGAVLYLEDISVSFDGFKALNRLSLSIDVGELRCVIGPNGAGKTTVFNAITGLYDPTEGRVLLDGRPLERRFTWTLVAAAALVGLLTALGTVLLVVNVDLLWKHAVKDVPRDQFTTTRALAAVGEHVRDRTATAAVGFAFGFVVGAAGTLAMWRRSRRAPDFIARTGVARTFQNIRLFQAMTVLENVLIGVRRSGRAAERDAAELLEFVGLGGRHNDLAQNLPYGDQRRLEIARALATLPRLVLLDEPAAGMNPSETAGLMALIRRIRDRGVTVLLIEHHMNLVMGISDRVAVLDHGRKIAEGAPREIVNDAAVVEAYLGSEQEA